MILFRPRWFAVPALSLAVCTMVPGWAQTTQDHAPSEHAHDRGVGNARDRGLSESVRRFGREHPNARILSVEPVLIQGRSLNRIKSLDTQGRIRIHIDDPQAPPRRANDGGGGR